VRQSTTGEGKRERERDDQHDIQRKSLEDLNREILAEERFLIDEKLLLL